MNQTRLARCRRKAWHWLVGVVLCVFLCGCGSGGPYPVDGRVVWKDGSPATELAGSQVVFDLPEKQTSARGIVQADGSFHLSTNKPDDGALAGEHKVAIIETRKQQGGPDSSNIAPGVMDARFYDLKTSGLSATVKPGTNKITLTVERFQRR
jgi:hypothetical protein